MKRSLTFFAPALVLALALAGQSQATPIPTSGPSVTVTWTNNMAGIPVVQSDGLGGYVPDPFSGGVVFHPELSSPTIQDKTQFAATGVTLSTSASPSNPDYILAPSDGSGTNYAVTVDLKHTYLNSLGVSTVADAQITFNSLITGSMYGPFTDSNGNVIAGAAELTNSIHDIFYNGVDHLVAPGTNPSALVTLGDATVNVHYYSFAPILPSQNTPGAISFDVTPAWGSAISQGGNAPEPSSIVLGCLGLSCIGGVFYRSRRRKAAETLKAMAV